MGYTLSVDIGGTKIATGILNENRMWVAEHVEKSNCATEETMYSSLLAAIYQVLNKSGLMKNQVNNLGVAIPGQVDMTEGIAIYSNNLPWRNFYLGDLLKNEFPTAVVGFEHDVRAAAVGEAEIRNFNTGLFVYVTVSTGIGASILLDGKPLKGCGMAGEIGFFPVNGGTLETSASGSAMERETAKEYGCKSLQDAFDQWNQGDSCLHAYFDKKASEIANAIFHVSALLDPARFVLGGGVINNQPNFYELVKKHYISLCHHSLHHDWHERLEPSLLKNKSGLFGAACTVLRSLEENLQP
ncbi:hypothetical protein AM500_18180 [Bacillus sp. FJAT-18017]|uniref:ROK family protein n=1 Tax=Bacillus sp. FJAT-18017 TaxID=1705566 RepID=UPI0006ADA6B6|nr:ROK family protein [Bacillus sp. FJAT-18017]ALC91497.1 hypothetical protein AM500_18180 [Bacillus sp. FJAT-18017]